MNKQSSGAAWFRVGLLAVDQPTNAYFATFTTVDANNGIIPRDAASVTIATLREYAQNSHHVTSLPPTNLCLQDAGYDSKGCRAESSAWGWMFHVSNGREVTKSHVPPSKTVHATVSSRDQSPWTSLKFPNNSTKSTDFHDFNRTDYHGLTCIQISRFNPHVLIFIFFSFQEQVIMN